MRGRKKKEEERRRRGKRKGEKGRELRDRYVDQISSVSAHNNCGFYLFAKGRKRKKQGGNSIKCRKLQSRERTQVNNINMQYES